MRCPLGAPRQATAARAPEAGAARTLARGRRRAARLLRGPAALAGQTLGGIDVTKPYKFIGFGGIEVTKPYKFIGFWGIEVTKPYKFIGFGGIEVPTRPPKEEDRIINPAPGFRPMSGPLGLTSDLTLWFLIHGGHARVFDTWLLFNTLVF